MLKTTDSRLFETAYFVLRPGSDKEQDKSTIVAEANRLVSDVCGQKRGRGKESVRQKIKNFFLFFGGSLMGALVVILILFLGTVS